MTLHQFIKALLKKNQIPHHCITAPDTISLSDEWMTKAVPQDTHTCCSLLQDRCGKVLAIYPANNQLNLAKLNKALRRQLSFIDSDALSRFTENHLLTNGRLLKKESGVQIIIDELSSNQDMLFFELPYRRALKVSPEDLEQIANDILLGSRFSSRIEEEVTSPIQTDRMSALYIRQQIKEIESLPPMPETARRLLAIRNSSTGTLKQLHQVIKQDPVLVAQIMRYANSALYGHKGNIEELHDAMFRVLGYDTTLHLALGFSFGQRFKLTQHGHLGQSNFWRHALYSAALAQKLSYAMPQHIRPKPGVAYLAGLLHDMGYLVLAEAFEPQYQWLNDMASKNEDAPISSLEKLVLGVHHGELGSLLMQHWHMPEELITAMLHHHNPHYDGPFAEYANLIYLCDCLLHPYELAYTDHEDIPAEIYTRLQLDEEQIYLIMDDVIQGDETFRSMASNM